MRLWTAVLIASIACAGCKKLPNGSSLDRGEALKVSDAFISAVQADRIDEALSMMEREAVEGAGHDQARALSRYVFNYCGRPGRVYLKREAVGAFLYADGRTKPERSFFYGTTTTDTKQDCTFSIEVVPGQGGMKIAKFGSLRPKD